jgi:hypothetical protein
MNNHEFTYRFSSISETLIQMESERSFIQAIFMSGFYEPSFLLCAGNTNKNHSKYPSFQKDFLIYCEDGKELWDTLLG